MSNLKLIGKGSFTKCYLMPDQENVLLVTQDPVKEVIAHDWTPKTKLLPQINFTHCGNYSMKYYPKNKSLKNELKPLHWLYYQELRKLFLSMAHTKNIYDGYDTIYKAFKTIGNRYLRKTMIDILDGISNIGSDIGFEISPRNVRADKNGNLILLDCFFSRSLLKKVNSTKKHY